MSDTRRPWEPHYDAMTPTPIRQAIGDRTQTSFRDIPQFSVTRQVIATELVEARQFLKKGGTAPLPSYNDYLLKLVALALKELPQLNSWYEDGQIKLLRAVNVGFVCDTDEGILLPTVFDADQKPLTQIATETEELIGASRAGRLRASLQKGAGFTLTNIGPTSVDFFHGIISPPQTAILAIGSLAERPVAEAGGVRVAPTLYLTITLDHRAHDGRHGANFLAALARGLADRGLLASL
jgi:pyruvate dehydrogenase E2 component (dihydrolipoamide acetyltransferase)